MHIAYRQRAERRKWCGKWGATKITFSCRIISISAADMFTIFFYFARFPLLPVCPSALNSISSSSLVLHRTVKPGCRTRHWRWKLCLLLPWAEEGSFGSISIPLLSPCYCIPIMRKMTDIFFTQVGASTSYSLVSLCRHPDFRKRGYFPTPNCQECFHQRWNFHMHLDFWSICTNYFLDIHPEYHDRQDDSIYISNGVLVVPLASAHLNHTAASDASWVAGFQLHLIFLQATYLIREPSNLFILKTTRAGS